MRNLLLIILIFSVLMSCNEEDEDYGTILNMSFIDEKGEAVSNADVVIYSTLENFQKEQEAIAHLTTDVSGSCSYIGLRSDSFYYIDARKGTKTNWIYKKESPYIEDGINTYKSFISDNLYSNLSSQNGKVWHAYLMKNNNIWYDHSGCVTGGSYKFLKNFELEFIQNNQCLPSENGSYIGTWVEENGVINTYNQYKKADFSLEIIETTPENFEAKLNGSGKIQHLKFKLGRGF